MQPFPHRYVASAVAGPEAEVLLESEGLAALRTTTPPEFGGPAGRWSPETLFVAAIADCYALTFRGLAARSKLPWHRLVCDVAGTLDLVDRAARFTRVEIEVRLQIPEQASLEVARRLLVKAEEMCLITRSLTAYVRLGTSVETMAPQAA